jgi:hypothetical protein
VNDEPERTPPGEGPAEQRPPSEEELRRRLEEELRKLRVQDVLLQSVGSLINRTSRRIAKEDERDLEQARLGIDAVRALTDLLDPEAANQVRNALSELQVAYAREASGEPADRAEQGGPPEGGAEQAPPAGRPAEPRGGEPGRPSKLWTPPGTS